MVGNHQERNIRMLEGIKDRAKTVTNKVYLGSSDNAKGEEVLNRIKD